MICAKEDLDLGARYELLGVQVAGAGPEATVTFFLVRNASGLSGFIKGISGEGQIIQVDERTAFEFANLFDSASPKLLAQSDSAYAFDHAGASIQWTKIERGLAIDCPKHPYVASIVTVGQYQG